jgi:heme/copper-type cytochrome/quinol oxidase subunit 3
MKSGLSQIENRVHAELQSRFVLRFFLVSVGLLACSALVCLSLIYLLGPSAVSEKLKLSPSFLCSTALLVTGSCFLQRALGQVKIERQTPFRQALRFAVMAGMLFVAVQSYALWNLVNSQNVAEAQTGVSSFVFVLTGLHGMHFGFAFLCLVFITLKAHVDRYDHEYYWGVTVGTCFWHLLLVVWFCILAVFGIASL